MPRMPRACHWGGLVRRTAGRCCRRQAARAGGREGGGYPAAAGVTARHARGAVGAEVGVGGGRPPPARARWRSGLRYCGLRRGGRACLPPPGARTGRVISIGGLPILAARQGGGCGAGPARVGMRDAGLANAASPLRPGSGRVGPALGHAVRLVQALPATSAALRPVPPAVPTASGAAAGAAPVWPVGTACWLCSRDPVAGTAQGLHTPGQAGTRPAGTGRALRPSVGRRQRTPVTSASVGASPNSSRTHRSRWAWMRSRWPIPCASEAMAA